MTHAHINHGQEAVGKPATELDTLSDDFTSPEPDDLLDRQLFAFRESLADYRSL